MSLTLDPAAIRRAAQARGDLCERIWRDLHRIPELALTEERTTAYVETFLRERGVALRRLRDGTGGVATIGTGPARVLLRADLDALPVTEETGCAFASTHAGCMHACGHDAHTAMLLCAADALVAGEVPLDGSVMLFFQPAEEGRGGALAFLEEGFLDDADVSGAFALHVWPGLPTGSVGLAAGSLMASADMLRVHLYGRGGHGAYPHRCIDPVVMAAETVMLLQTLVSRRIDPLESGVVTVGSVHGGTAPNIIPDEVTLEVTVRAHAPAVRQQLMEGLRGVCDGVAARHGGSWKLEELSIGYPPTVNDARQVQRLTAALSAVLGDASVGQGRRTMGAEDMSFILERIPGCYLQLGTGTGSEGEPPLHSARFLPDPACFPLGIAAHLTATQVLGAA